MNVLILAAHPDDIEILCAGTAARYVRDGHKVTYCVMTDGQVSSRTIPNEELIVVRRGEAKAAADVVGAELIHMEIKDEMLFDDEPTRLQVLDVLLQVRPDVLITHSPTDYSMDHRACLDLVLAVVPMSVLSNGYSGRPHLERHPAIYLMDTIAGIDFAPSEYVDITDVMDVKLKAFACHKSQTRAFADLGFELDETVRVQSRFRGMQAGCRYAEAFAKLANWYSGLTKRRLP